jgi:hypothetical protein
MDHFLDSLPLDFSNPGVQDLLGTLVSNYSSAKRATPLVAKAGIPLGEINFDQAMVYVWPEILTVARNKNKLRTLLTAIAESDEPEIAARVSEILADAPVLPAPGASGAIEWKIDPADASGEERQIELEPTLLDIAFLERGLELAPSVARLLVTLGDDDFYGTAFRIADDLLLTNHHVLFDSNGPASRVVAWFGFERSFGGADRAHVVVECDSASIVGAAEDDWAVVRTTTPMPAAAKVIPLAGAPVPEVGDRVYVIQHPNGGVKKIGMIHNVVVGVTDDVVQYLADTAGGSSGSPVFDEQWRLVALHHKWDQKTVAGKPQYFNQGRRIDKVGAELTKAGVL